MNKALMLKALAAVIGAAVADRLIKYGDQDPTGMVRWSPGLGVHTVVIAGSFVAADALIRKVI